MENKTTERLLNSPSVELIMFKTVS